MSVDPASVNAAIDAALVSSYLPLIVVSQNAYFAANGRFWQGLVTHSTIPQDGAYVAPNNLVETVTVTDANGIQTQETVAVTPSYEFKGWLDLNYPTTNGQPNAIQVQAWIDQYSGPAGFGYCLSMQWQESATGIIWRKVVDCGVEPYRNQDWAQVAA